MKLAISKLVPPQLHGVVVAAVNVASSSRPITRPYSRPRNSAKIGAVNVEVAARKFAIPYECPCCGEGPDTEMRIPLERLANQPVAPDSPRALDFPYCKRCEAHAAASESAGVPSAGVMAIGIVAGGTLALATRLWVGALVFVAALPLAWLVLQGRRRAARARCTPSCASTDRAVAYHGWTGSRSSFAFKSLAYTARFAEQNADKLVDLSPQLQKLLEGHKLARLAVPTPAVATHAVPPPLGVREWIARIERAHGAVARRKAFQQATEMLGDLREKQQVILATTQLELAPIADRIALATTPAARHHELTAAISEIRADNIPEALQAAMLYQLEEQLRALPKP